MGRGPAIAADARRALQGSSPFLGHPRSHFPPKPPPHPNPSQAMALAESLARRVEQHGGAALIIDYGQVAGAAPALGCVWCLIGSGCPLCTPGLFWQRLAAWCRAQHALPCCHFHPFSTSLPLMLLPSPPSPTHPIHPAGCPLRVLPAGHPPPRVCAAAAGARHRRHLKPGRLLCAEVGEGDVLEGTAVHRQEQV